MTRPPLVLVGPTASGKSATALELARLRRAVPGAPPVELVSCDSMQVYRGMEVGTASPTPRERDEVPHHVVGVADPSEEFHLARFVELVRTALDDIAGRGAEAVLVGGTGLYVRAVVDDLEVPGRYPEVAAELEALPTDELAGRLARLDPVAAARVPPGNRRRLLRALEVTVGSGRPFSASGPGLDAYPPTRFLLAGLRVDRDALGGRIERRVRRQLHDGWLEEAAALAARPAGWSRTASVALGYAELCDHLAGRRPLEAAVADVVRRTRRFAVRQERWFRRDPRITWFDAPGDPVAAGSGRDDGGAGDAARGPVRTAASVAAELDGWWSAATSDTTAPAAGESAADPSASTATVTGAAPSATGPGADGPEPTCCD